MFCSCNPDKFFSSKKGLNIHQTRYCPLRSSVPQQMAPLNTNLFVTPSCSNVNKQNNINITNPQNTCISCTRSFATYIDLRQHQRLKHAEDYNKGLEIASIGARQQWSKMEIENMASEEAKYGSTKKGLLDHLVGIVGRTKEAVKGRRIYEEYRDLVKKIHQ